MFTSDEILDGVESLIGFGSRERPEELVSWNFVLRGSIGFHEILQLFFIDGLMFLHESFLKADFIASCQVVG